MNLFRKLFGAKQDQAAAAATPPAEEQGEQIRVYDEFGRELLISKQDWLDSVLLNLKKAWNNPDELASLLISAFQDGFHVEVEDAAKRLHKIDPEVHRGASLLAIVCLQTDRAKQAEKLLTTHVARHGEEGTVLTNLAKAQAAQGRPAKAMETLWRGLELDPNQENGMGWYWVEVREKDGEEAGLAALRRIAALPGSWRAQLQLAGNRLEQQDLQGAKLLYAEALSRAERPVPVDLLQQMSGDLGKQGHLIELLELSEPHFDLDAHGLEVGNNLIKAYFDLGQLDATRDILRKLAARQRPDWREHIDYWEDELGRAEVDRDDTVPREELRLTLLAAPGPLWLDYSHAIAKHFPQKDVDALHIAFAGSSFDSSRLTETLGRQRSDAPGRLSRALPLLLSEQVYLGSEARTSTVIPWLLNNGGAFMVSGKRMDDEDAAQYARRATTNEEGLRVADYLVNCHLVPRGEDWALQLRLIRTIDASCLEDREFVMAEGAFRDIAYRVLAELRNMLNRHLDLALTDAGLPCKPEELDHYLFRLEQTLAARCSNVEGSDPGNLINPAEILDGMIQLALQSPESIPPRFLLWRCLDAINKSEPELVKALRTKVRKLMQDSPLQRGVHEALVKVLEAVTPAR